MRVFFAIEPDPDTALAIDSWRQRQFSSDASAVPVANFHLTLAFAGDFSAPQLERLGQQVDDWLARKPQPAGALQLNQTGYWSKPGIYWLGASECPDDLSRLADKLRSLVVRAGARRDRRTFLPHVTLFRRCHYPPPAPAQTPEFTLDYRHFGLYESRAGKAGVSYHPLLEWELAR